MQKTVLVLGAGASMPYGFPSGQDLLNQICNMNMNMDRTGNSDLDFFVDQLGFKTSEYRDFITDLKKSGRQSVDAFLENRRELEKIGKAFIAYHLIPYERPELLHAHASIKDPWYSYLFNKVFTVPDAPLSVLTFNYDRSLEYYLLEAIKSSFGETVEGAVRRLEKIPIIHLHGSMGHLPDLSDTDIRDYDQERKAMQVDTARNGIKIIYEDIKDNTEFKTANSLLDEAEIICFLGFGYHETNLGRLAVHKRDRKQTIMGTGFGLTEAERFNIGRHFFSRIYIDGNSKRSLEFLRHSTPFEKVYGKFLAKDCLIR